MADGNEADDATSQRSNDLTAEMIDAALALTDARSSGTSIQDFVLDAFLGEGSTAHVYLARRVATNEQVAVKVIDKLFVRQAQLEHKVQREILLHGPLEHPHVVSVKDAFEDSRNHYLVLEYCEKGSVASLVRVLKQKRQSLDEATAKNIFRQTAAGVAYLHARGIIHRDLKLSNLLLTSDGDVKISDFGLATFISEEHATVCGTPNFIAPEVLLAGESSTYDETADIWSLGCILYTLLLGKPPFEGSKVSETLANVSNAGIEPLHFPQGFSATIGDLIKRMLNRDSKSRPTISQVLAHPWLRSSASTKVGGDEGGHRPSRSPPAPLKRSRVLGRKASATSRPTSRLAAPHRRLTYRSDGSSDSDDVSLSSLDFSGLDLSSSSLSDSNSIGEELKEASKKSSAEANSVAQMSGVATDGEVAEITPAVVPEIEFSKTTDAEQPERMKAHRAANQQSNDVHFLGLHIEVKGLTFLGHAPEATCEIVWNCWESRDVRQLTRFTGAVGKWDVEYIPSAGLLQGSRPDGSLFKHNYSQSAGSKDISTDDDLVRAFKLVQILSSRCLQLRGAARSVDIDSLPIRHFDTLPVSIVEALRRESLRSCIMHHLTLSKNEEHESPLDSNRMHCSIQGVGVGEFDQDNNLIIRFTSGSTLFMTATGSIIRYRRCPDEVEDEFDLGRMPFLPSEVKNHFEHVTAFIRRLKSSS